MWPWEHLAFGYVLFSLVGRLGRDVSPNDGAAWSVVLFTQLPDLIDKPLAWKYGVLLSGQSVAHSIFVALPVSGIALVIGWRRHRGTTGLAVAVGYLSHLAGDVVYPALTGGTLRFGAILWPLVVGSSSRETGFVERIRELFADFLTVLTSENGVLLLGFEALLICLALWLWYDDGCPGIPRVRGVSDGQRRPQ